MPPDTEADSLCEGVGHDIYLERSRLASSNDSATVLLVESPNNLPRIGLVSRTGKGCAQKRS